MESCQNNANLHARVPHTCRIGGLLCGELSITPGGGYLFRAAFRFHCQGGTYLFRAPSQISPPGGARGRLARNSAREVLNGLLPLSTHSPQLPLPPSKLQHTHKHLL